MLDFAEIPNVDRSKIVVIRSRLGSLDAKIGGFNAGEMSIWSGGNASGNHPLMMLLFRAVTEYVEQKAAEKTQSTIHK